MLTGKNNDTVCVVVSLLFLKRKTNDKDGVNYHDIDAIAVRLG